MNDHGNVLIVVGTRPEAIKLAPVARSLAIHHGRRPLLCVTGQQRQMLDQVLEIFDWKPDFDLDLMQAYQSLTDVTSRVMQGITGILAACKPAIVVVQGDTATAFAAALAAFHAQIPVAHVEAGLRSGNIQDPFPEEAYRRMITDLATWHFAPTDQSFQYLRSTGIPATNVFLTGNTVVDAMQQMLRLPCCVAAPSIPGIDWDKHKVLLATAHRRENWARMQEICEGLRGVLELDPAIRILFPVHPNRVIRDVVHQEFAHTPGIVLLEPQTYSEFLACLSRVRLVLTDSGGVQEEATSLGKPIVILRKTTERPEALSSGLGVLAGTDPAAILSATSNWLITPPAGAGKSNPAFGDGRASERIAEVLVSHLEASGSLFMPAASEISEIVSAAG